MQVVLDQRKKSWGVTIISRRGSVSLKGLGELPMPYTLYHITQTTTLLVRLSRW